MANLKAAHRELFRRSPDERFESLDALYRHCRQARESSVEHWERPQWLLPEVADGRFRMKIGTDGAFLMPHTS
jgi:hypothetical protein